MRKLFVKMPDATFLGLLVLIILSYCSTITQGKAIDTTISVENSTSEISTLIENDDNSTPLPDDIFGKAIDTAISVENSTSEISTLIENDDNSTHTTPLLDDIFRKSINIVKIVKNKFIEIGTPVKNEIIEIGTPVKNRIIEIGTPIMDNIRNSTSSKVPYVPDYIVDSLPTWAWIVVGITFVLVICCCYCCPEALGQILCCPFLCAKNIISSIFKLIIKLLEWIIKLPLLCLGFGKIGIRACSCASCFQSCCYGGYTPAGSCFSCCQSCGMR